MGPHTRRQELINFLNSKNEPVSARSLAEKFSVSRQVIVGDIALLRAEGCDILSTPRGYLIPGYDEPAASSFEGKIVCLHTQQQTEEELQIIVDNGGQVLDVSVEHPLYGALTGKLRIANRYDISEFMKQLSKHQSKLLASLTDGLHMHTIQCPDAATFERIRKQLSKAGILYS